MKCSKCGTINGQSARFCRHCGERIPVGINVMDRYPKLNFVPTNLIDWKKPKVGMFIKAMLMIPAFLCLIVCLYCVWSSFFYNRTYYEGIESSSYASIVDPFTGLIYGEGNVYYFDGIYYSDHVYSYKDDKFYPAGERVYYVDVEERTTEKALKDYKEKVWFNFSNWMIILVVLLILHFVICGYVKRPKDAKPLSELADYCQKYSYYGIFRRKKTPKFVFFVKDNKFGILDVAHYNVFLPAKYDYLEWREKKKYLNAVIDGRNCIIDINGKELK